MIIAVIGKKYSGKTTFSSYIDKSGSFVSFAFADPIKKICKETFSLTDDQLHDPILKETLDPRWNKTPRELFQIVGTDLFRERFDKDIWVNVVRHQVNRVDPEKNIIFTDIRFQNELDFIVSLNRSEPVVVVEIRRPHDHRSSMDTHSSETVELEYPYKTFLDNDGTLEEFYEKINQFKVEKLKMF